MPTPSPTKMEYQQSAPQAICQAALATIQKYHADNHQHEKEHPGTAGI